MLALIRISGFGLCRAAAFIYSSASTPSVSASSDESAKPFTASLDDSAGRPASLLDVTAGVQGKGDRLADVCGAQTWPYIAPACLPSGQQNRAPVRAIVATPPDGLSSAPSARTATVAKS